MKFSLYFFSLIQPTKNTFLTNSKKNTLLHIIYGIKNINIKLTVYETAYYHRRNCKHPAAIEQGFAYKEFFYEHILITSEHENYWFIIVSQSCNAVGLISILNYKLPRN